MTPQERIDANFGLLAWRMTKLWAKTDAQPRDFMPVWNEDGRQQSAEAMMAAIEGVFKKR